MLLHTASSVVGGLSLCEWQDKRAKTMPRREGASLGLWEAKVSRNAPDLHRRCPPRRVFTAPCPRGRGARVWTQVTRAPATRWTTPLQCPRLKIRSANSGTIQTKSAGYPGTGAEKPEPGHGRAAPRCNGASHSRHGGERRERPARLTRGRQNGHRV